MVYTIKGLAYIKKHDPIYFSIIHILMQVNRRTFVSESVECLGRNPDWNLESKKLSETKAKL
jgi:hypothetical protein